MTQWLIADITFLDVHLQLWMHGHRHYLALVRLRLGDPVAFATLHVSADDYRPVDRGRGFPFAAYTGFELKGHQAALAACNY